jgi:hypothetical protein
MDAARTAKNMQKLAALFAVDLGFLFQKESRYRKGLAALEVTDSPLAAYLRESRTWLEPLRLLRDELEHGVRAPARVHYDRVGTHVVPHEPQVLYLGITSFVSVIENRLYLFVEEVLMWCIQRRLPEPVALAEIPVAERDPNKAERFRVTLRGAEPIWELVYSSAQFNDV